ncbi:unconventional myosin-XVI-like [Stylophora pistillata]|uniref:unconventional myosin-XVI-like n=1 Tax=Stylophora pistillata TaxID=50429 RepID=UPI000C0566CD|nr:unconventional myosin-XVI-like [Stylophora pistillata]
MLYSRLFGWVVLKVNSCLRDKDNELRDYTGPSLGLLDVFGFEKCEINGLQQLCINTANEQLMHFYNQRVFAWEQVELESEGLKSQKISYYDNKKVVDLLLNPPQGLLPILEDESKTLSTDAAFVKKCSSANRKHSNYEMARLPYPSFTIRHYTAAVTYVAQGFINSNREMLDPSLLNCMQGSSNEFVGKLFRATISGTGSLSVHQERSAVPDILRQMKKNKKNPTLRHKASVVQHLTATDSRQAERGFHTIGSQLRVSIAELMKKVLSCEVHFIRCIKPNSYQSPDRFDPDTVLAQVRALAVVETIQMRNLGFPVWFPFDVFIKRFGILVGLPSSASVKDTNQTCQKMLRQLAGPQGWRLGKTKVFLKYWCLDRLYTLLHRFDSMAVVIQKVVRGWLARSLYSRLKRLKVAQENNVKSFLNTIGDRSEAIFQHNTNQVREEDSKQKHKQNELANVNRQAWSPNLLNQKSPSTSSQASSFDFPDTGSAPTSPRLSPPQRSLSDISEGSISDVFGPDSPICPGPAKSRASDSSVSSVSDVFGPDSPTRPGPPKSRASDLSLGSVSDIFGPDSPTRPGPPKSRASDLSLGSVSDIFGPDSPTRPGPPKSRASDLSILSVESLFSNESETEFDAAPLVWCKITCFEREIPRSEFSIDRPSIIIDGSNNAFDVTRIGLGSLPPSSDPKVTKLRNYVGKGVEIVNDEQGNVWVTRGSKNKIFVKGHFLSEEVFASKGVLEKDVTLKVFDWESFASLVRHHCLEPKNFDSDIEERILSSTSVYFSFVVDGEDDVNTPCWAQLDVLSAFNQAKAACKYARERKLQEKQKKQNSLPPILRPKTKKSRELAAVAHFQEQIRPRRSVDTDKYNRKAWARTEVAMNPFLYGKKENLTIMKALQKETTKESRKSLDAAFPQSPSAAFGNSNDMTDAGPEQITVVIDRVDDVGELMNQETYTTTTQKSGREKPGKKVWAKKKFAEDKAEKAKKRSS